MTRRELRMIESGKPVGAVEFDGQRLTFEGLAEPILGYLRKAVGDDQMFGADLMANGWMNMAVELAPEASRSLTPTEEDEDDVERAAGHDTTPGHDQLHHYWTVDPEGRAKWVDSPKPWTTLVAHLTRHVGPRKAKIFASRWFIEVFGYAAGSDKNRVAHGHPPRGNKVGLG